MTRSRTATVVQADLFGAPPLAVGVVEISAPAPMKQEPTKRRKLHTTQLDGHRRIQREGPTLDQRVEWDIKGNGKHGRTRQEIADRTGIPINSVCGAVDRLMKGGKVFEPVIGYVGPKATKQHFVRERRKVIVDALYQHTFDWLAFGQLLRTSAA